MVVFTSSVQHAWILKRTRNCMFVPFFMQSTVKKPCITWRKSEGYENQQTTGVLIAIHMIWPYLFDGLKCIQFDTNNGDLLKTLHVNGFIGVSILCATDRFIAPNTHVHCTQNTNENKSHNYICPLGKWYRFPIEKTPCKFNCIYWQAYTHKRENFFSWFDRMCHNNDRKNSSFCRILHILFSRLSHFALGSFFVWTYSGVLNHIWKRNK